MNMATRRQFALGAVALSSTAMFPKFMFADDPAENAIEDVPNEEGLADFALAWDLKQSGTVTLVAAAKDLPAGIAENYANIKFSAANGINSHFKNKTGSDFISWFNAKIAGRLDWAGKSIKGKEADFLAFWDQFLGQGPFSLMEFITCPCLLTRLKAVS
ncbi:hypothetical protein NKH14_23020 [Mesorhizobium sp. M1380]|uniref:hypothetical protein n=1 Tax=Mesorhizobium sp. M1380 TaxID=2957093 RepID=UPI00333882EA